MPSGFGTKLVIAISSRALFNLDESHTIFENQGLDAYARYQIDREDDFAAGRCVSDGAKATPSK